MAKKTLQTPDTCDFSRAGRMRLRLSQEQTPVKLMPFNTPDPTPIHPGMFGGGAGWRRWAQLFGGPVDGGFRNPEKSRYLG